LAALSDDELRHKLLHDPYLEEDLGSAPAVGEFLARLAARDEIALARQYPRAKLYQLLAGAERTAGGSGRPEAVDNVGEISAVLQELAKRASDARGGPTRR
jgi:hypothetical protein